MPTYTASTSDGYMYAYGGLWSAVRSSATANFSTDTTSATNTASGYFDNTNYYLSRSLTPFDTSGIPASATVTGVSLKLTRMNTYGSGQIVDVVNTSITSVSAAAFALANWGTSALGSFPASWTNNTDNTQTITGLTVNKGTGAVTYVGTRNRNDMSNTSPTGVNAGQWYSANEATTSYRPVLTVTYSGVSVTVTAEVSALTEAAITAGILGYSNTTADTSPLTLAALMPTGSFGATVLSEASALSISAIFGTPTGAASIDVGVANALIAAITPEVHYGDSVIADSASIVLQATDIVGVQINQRCVVAPAALLLAAANVDLFTNNVLDVESAVTELLAVAQRYAGAASAPWTGANASGTEWASDDEVSIAVWTNDGRLAAEWTTKK